MRKYISLFLSLICILALTACGKKADPITLPKTENILSVDVTVEGKTEQHLDEIWISNMISNISNSKSTSKESVQDVPQVENYIKIDIQFETGTSTLFAYKDKGKYYIEQPYQGIYETDSNLYKQLQETE
ncbi:DUF5301 domain-containing protein [Clostridium perfringens]|uniref:DUF5301 domain-containing protein n=1 Tax=Clostridium perfringens TaxID=1502 RepID=UPI0029715BB8|nr:DUF5301 domain-containing protein [Clostridium perfringens]MDK0728321.1 DUF5301 domain-containing protein [Clostridium perfringens]MDK0803621.1 DUF5301 domain-containing protein [Clostridium perfringens]MDM0547930.1 DUF5301 domain-containing protein [Clostridium perfringens]MDM0561870.1 DUF5301 domain-containing protein [Clostridium perfringens]MDM0565505.1 DUF5301 domain-containing protein [Clostridium perfringens]